MKYTKLFLLILMTISNITFSQNLNLMPVPKEIKLEDGEFRLDNNLSITITGNPDERLFPAATRAWHRLSGRTGLFFKQQVITPQTLSDAAEIILTVNRLGKVELGEDESYSLKISSDEVLLSAETDLGAMHGLETLLQLLQADENGYYFPTVEINDEPRFPWRGLMIDACRHFMPVEMVKRNLDGMAMVKMNVLHWHLSENQGFRVESKIYPKLHEMGSDGLYYTQAQIKDIIKYAADRGIRVYPEFDVPGHSTSWFVGYPELAAAPGPYEIEREWGVFDPAFNPTKEEVYEFLDNFFGEMADLFPDEYFHIGGDEVNGKQWNANEDIQNFMKENNIPDNHALQTYFNQRVLEILTKHGKKMVGWDEILQPGMPKNIVIQSWRGTDALIKAAQEGYTGILSNGYYIDLMQPTAYHYLNDPLPENSSLTEKEKKNILGGEATMWAELVTNETVDSRIWPRTAAIAERFWSPRNINDVDDMYRRLERISFLLEDAGLTHIKNYEMLLRRLTNNNDISALKTFVDIVEPLKGYQRHGQGVKYYQYSPYTRVVDAARPDQKVARDFRNMVDDYLAGAIEKEPVISVWLNIWKDNHEKLIEIIRLSPILKEIEPMSKNLSDLSVAGLEAINLIKSGKKADENWMNEKMNIVEQSKKSYGQVELMIVDPIEKLILRAEN